jgi:loricrin
MDLSARGIAGGIAGFGALLAVSTPGFAQDVGGAVGVGGGYGFAIGGNGATNASSLTYSTGIAAAFKVGNSTFSLGSVANGASTMANSGPDPNGPGLVVSGGKGFGAGVGIGNASAGGTGTGTGGGTSGPGGTDVNSSSSGNTKAVAGGGAATGQASGTSKGTSSAKR